MGVALLLVLVVRFSGGSSDGGTGASSSPGPSAAATALPTGVAPSNANPSNGGASAVPSRTPLATKPAATPKASPTATRTPAAKTYRVRSGDTLSGIAARFGTTVAVLMRLNNIKDPRSLRVGQVLKLP